MKKTLCLSLIAFGLSLSAFADKASVSLKLNPTWKVFLNVKRPANCDKIPQKLKSPDGKAVAPLTAELKDNVINLNALGNSESAPRQRAMLYNEFEAPKAGIASVGAAADYWMSIYLNGKKVYDTMSRGNESGDYSPNAHRFKLPVKAGRNLLAVEVLAGSNGWKFAFGEPTKPLLENVKFAENAEWKKVDMSHLAVKAGSALDQSAISAIYRPESFLSWLGLASTSARPPRLGIGPTGKLVTVDDPDRPVKLRGCSINYPWTLEDATKDPDWRSTWKQEAINLRRQGYNAARFTIDYGIDHAFIKPDFIDKADQFLAILGEQGIYVHFCLGFYMRKSWNNPGKERRDYRLRMYLGDSAVRASWRLGAEELMNHVNPYTGLKWKDDPTLSCVDLSNEQEWGLFTWSKRSKDPQTVAELDVRFRRWLEAKYKNVTALSKAWGGKKISSFADVNSPMTIPLWKTFDAFHNDYLLFCVELSRENIEWMENTLRATGYKGLIAQYNVSQWLGGQEVRYEYSQVTIANSYHNHPSGFVRPGSRCEQNSAVGTASAYWRAVAATRFADRPFVETEFCHSFWNPYQHECFLFGGYSALQGFDAIITHEGPAFFRKNRPITCFSIGRSPILRATEFVSACLFLRGDVKASPHRVQVDIPKGYIDTDCRATKTISSTQNKIALMTGFSVAFPGARRPAGVGEPSKPDLVMPPAKGSGFKAAGGGWAIETTETKDPDFSLKTVVDNLKAKGILPQDNLSDPDKGIYQSDTGEILTRIEENLLKIATPRSEVVTLEGGKGERVGKLDVISTSVPAMVAACAVDEAPLAESERIVLVYATEAANNGMELSPDRVKMVKIGDLTVLARVGELNIKLSNANATNLKLYALGFDGSRREELPLNVDGNTLKINLNTGALKNGPTPFFELVKFP